MTVEQISINQTQAFYLSVNLLNLTFALLLHAHILLSQAESTFSKSGDENV